MFLIQKLRKQEEMLKRQIELEREVQQKKKEEDERRVSSKKGWNKLENQNPTEENDMNQTNFRTNSPPIPTMRQKETDKNDEENKTGESATQEHLIASNRFENKEKVEKVERAQNSKSPKKKRGNSSRENDAVVAQLQSMRQGLERKKKMLNEENLENDGWDALE